MIAQLMIKIIDSVAGSIIANSELLSDLDRAIGDGDHGINMERGLNAVLNIREELSVLSFSKALQKIGTTLVMRIGGASGPLYGSLFIATGKASEGAILDIAGIAHVISEGVSAVKKRGKSDMGEKTMLDVLIPVSNALNLAASKNTDLKQTLEMLRAAADKGLDSTLNIVATKGRASFLGKRSIGHLDPGAKSSQLLVRAVCDSIEKQMTQLQMQTKQSSAGCVGIVIVSHSTDVAKGIVDMVRQMVGDEVPVSCCGGNSEGGLGTDVASIKTAIEQVWNSAGVAVLVDLGGAETNTEMAIEMLHEEKQSNVIICNAPIVEGAVMAATESAGGGSLEEVRATAELMSL
ncbi:MAG: dihydroxyacetone kinase subunit L [Desulfobacula sp.]|uniref:dihydroxyacetone kinase subunit DhaL n=1 Tax=Desulfobacula sp. TaxID=2593537 RepID=UPI0025BBA827|nr:dihydroxyacetone kinase subunit DhaL [Desulfobacula sp.]MCD4719696.1 dihydroxyacetone kinase subunit L [Desulfobacula sp.]